ncbi:MAG: bifunctional methylenetetrahydrofolate dehydrogenase/methenyltetrahydrofolate cyclohydrolase, partial [Alphaproteobacteria bacterium]|nr:bifunctional methylenetetrahydrofolate dehydrogenase/methenyltetrahydrofolate cyclohydrolase [Alphaproteobacteria bacterium]
MAAIIDGRAIAAKLRGRVAEEVVSLAAEGIVPGLAVVLVGDDPASQVYVRSKVTQTLEAGMR